MISLDTLELPEEMVWLDELEWDGIQASSKRTLQGKFLVQQQQAPSEAGRPVTLSSENAWIKREDIETLLQWSQDLTKQMILTLHDGRIYPCRFRHWDKPVIDAPPLSEIAFHNNNTLYKLSLRLTLI